MKNFILTLSFLSIVGFVNAQVINTIAGTGSAGFSGDGGPATAGRLNGIAGLTNDRSGNLYFVDQSTRVRKVSATGIISTIAGNGSAGFSGDGGPATAASLNYPIGLALDSLGNLYIVDQFNQRIRKVNTSGIISTIAGTGSYGFSGDGGVATAANLAYPSGIAIDASSNIFVIDRDNNRIRKINTSGIISTVAGNGGRGYSGDGGAATAASLFNPFGIAVDNSANIFIADKDSHRIRKVNASGIITTFAGNGSAGFSGDGGAATSANLYFPFGIALDIAGNVYIADDRNQRIRKVSTSGTISTIAGNGSAGFSGDGGAATVASLNGPNCVVSDSSGNIYIADNGNFRIRKVSSCTSGSLAAISGASSVNIGSSVTLTNATPGGTWSSSNTSVASVSASGAVAGIGTGNATIRYTVSTICSTPTVTRNITVVNPLAPVFTAGSPTLKTTCAGQVTNIDANLSVRDIDTGATLTWTLQTAPLHGSATVAYTATSTGGSVRTAGRTYTPTAGYTGADSFKVRVSNGTFFADLRVLITVNPAPSAPSISGASELCLGSSVTLSGTPSGGNFYSTTGGIVCSSSGFVTATSAGTSAVTYQAPPNSYGCSNKAFQAIVVKRPISPNSITGSSAVCQGASITLSHAVSGGSWASRLPALASVTGGTVTGIAPGVDSITYTVTDVCGTNTAVRRITVNPLPVAGTITGTTIVPAGTFVTLGRTSATAGTWASSDNTIATVNTTGRVRGIRAGTDTISFSVTNSCGTARAISVISVTGGKMAETGDDATNNIGEEATAIKVYPNPTAGFVNIEIAAVHSAEIMLLSMEGRLITNIVVKEPKTQIDCSQLPAGIYLLRIIADGKLTDKKIVVN